MRHLASFLLPLAIAACGQAPAAEEWNAEPELAQWNAFAQQNPITPSTYQSRARAYVMVHDERLGNTSPEDRAAIEGYARDFAAFTEGLFAAYTSAQIYACLEWQSLDAVTYKHARRVAVEEGIQYPFLDALFALKLACADDEELARLRRLAAGENPE